jgi:hypothetical protein
MAVRSLEAGNVAIKQLTISDLTGREIPDGQVGKVIVQSHPAISQPVVLDVAADELDKLQPTKIDIVNLVVYGPDGSRWPVAMELKQFTSLFAAGTDVDDLLANSRPSDEPKPSGAGTKKARSAAKAPSRGEGVDYTAHDRFGQIHRGRVTYEEAFLVRGDREQASRNRELQTGAPIDWDDPKEKKRYGL